MEFEIDYPKRNWYRNIITLVYYQLTIGNSKKFEKVQKIRKRRKSSKKFKKDEKVWKNSKRWTKLEKDEKVQKGWKC